MFGFKKKKTLISVSFFDIETGEPLAVLDMPLEQLPASFEARTTFNINNEHWEVLKANPMTFVEFEKCKWLELIVKKVNIVEGVDPNTLLFSLPTISNELPAIQEGSTKIDKNAFEIREDDWRQIDVLPLTVMDLANENLKAIQNVYNQNSLSVDSGTAFKKLHVRSGLDYPFQSHHIKYSSLCTDFPNATAYEGISFDGVAGIIENSFAFDLKNGLILYGLMKDDILHNFSVFATRFEESLLNDLSNILSKYDLFIVDWCRMKTYIKEK